MKMPSLLQRGPLCLLAITSLTGSAYAIADWVLPAPDVGLFNVGTNWSTGNPPAAAEVVNINNGGTASLEAGMTYSVGLTAVGGPAGTTGFLDISGGSLTTASDVRIGGGGTAGTGTLTMSGGFLSPNPGNFNIGFGPVAGGANGTVNLSGGTIYVRNAASIMTVGNRGNGTLTQSGGEIFLSSSGATPSVMNIGRGATGMGTAVYTCSGGSLTAGEFRFGNIVLNAGSNTVNLSGTGTMTVGLISIVNTAVTNTFNFTGGTLSAVTVNFPLVNNGGTLKPGVFDFTKPTAAEVLVDPTGTMSFGTNISYTQNSGSLAIDIDGAASNDQLSLGAGASVGNATLGGTIAVTLLNSYNPPLGTTFDIVTADAIANTASVTGLTPSGYRFAPTLVTGTDGRKILRLVVALIEPDDDFDGMGDAWELAHGLNPLVNDAALDPDLDGLLNLGEFQKNTDPQDSDTDNDGLSDGVENGTGVYADATHTGTQPLLLDTDGDGLSDGIENPSLPFTGPTQPGTNPNLFDTDGDTFPDGVEIAQGSNPTNATSYPNPAIGSTLAVDFGSATTGVASPVQDTFVGMDPSMADGSGAWTTTFGTHIVTVRPLGSVTVDHRDRAAAGGGGIFNALYRDFIFANASADDGDGLEVVISGLLPLQAYPISIWSWDPSSAGVSRHSTWFASDGNNGVVVKVPLYNLVGTTPLPAATTDRLIKFDARTDEDGTLFIRGLKEDGYVLANAIHNVFLNALVVGPPVSQIAITQVGPALSGGTLPLTWTSDAVGKYRIQRSTNLLDWTTAVEEVPGLAGATSFTLTNLPPDNTTGFFRVVRTAP